MIPRKFTPPAAMDATVRDAAEQVLAYLAEVDSRPSAPVDAVIGFGVFDLTLPRFCADLYAAGLVRNIIFTGGLGAGTGDLGGPEADVWRDEVRRTHPEIPAEAIITENKSTNTAENIQFTRALLARDHPALAFGTGIKRAVIVASPSRLRRVRLTLRLLVPELEVTRLLPAVDFGAELRLYTSQGVDYFAHLRGELERIATYPARGWIAPEDIPQSIVHAGQIVAARSGRASASS